VLKDVVIDTNVLAHADNPNESRQAASIAMIEGLLPAHTMVAIDEGLSLDEGQNKSRIWAEYKSKIPPTCALASYFLQQILSTERLQETPAKVDVAVAKKINQMIAKASDRVFLRVAINTAEKLLVSHDFNDFAESKRADIRKRMNVTVCDASALPTGSAD
jgi:hypothetical protein